MITWMQQNRKYLVVTLWVSAIAFIGSGAVGWGAYKYGGAGADSVAKVGNIDISNSDLRITTNQIFQYYNSLFQGRFTKEQAEKMHLQEQALGKLINEALLLNYADELGITALKEDIIKEYASIKAFQVDGHFSKSRLEQILRAQGMSKKEFENQIKKSIRLKKLEQALKLPPTPLEEEALFAGKELENHLIIKKIASTISEINPKEEEIKAFWQKHQANYKSPKSYTVEIVEIPDSDAKFDEKVVHDFYDKHKYQYKNKEGKIKSFEDSKEELTKALAHQKAKKEALKRYLDLKKGKIKTEKTITIAENNQSIDIHALSQLKSGDFIKAVEKEGGWLSGKLISVNPPAPLTYEQAKEFAKKDLARELDRSNLTSKAKELVKEGFKEGEDLGFVSLGDATKIKALSPSQSAKLLQVAFQKPDKSGYIMDRDGAIVYQIKEQKLFDSDRFKSEESKLKKNIQSLKLNAVMQGLVEKLKKQYEIKQLVKFTNQKEG